MTTDFSIFQKIRLHYAQILPEWMEDYEATGRMHHDPYTMDWLPFFSPIESPVWSDIRCSGIPFYPQIPALNYFIDFACPMLKIGIECDGKDYHDERRDAIRDSRLAEAGWTIFRIEGHECKRLLTEPWDMDPEEPHYAAHVFKWLMSTSEGIVWAIKSKYFVDEPCHFARDNWSLIEQTLNDHRTTPFVNIHRRNEVRKDGGPIRLSDSMGDYVARLLKRMGRI